MPDETRVGKIEWIDLTVPDAEKVKDFYQQVVGWTVKPVEMGGYSDYEMRPPQPGSAGVSGVCHASGVNAKIPPQWMIYVGVADVQESVKRCEALGGKVVCKNGEDRYVIQDPAGAVMMICQV